MGNRLTISNTAEQEFFKSPSLFAQTQSINIVTKELGTCYLVTEVPSCDFASNIATNLFAVSQYQYSFASQYIVVSLANELFKSSKPMVGEELEILRNTYRRLLKQIPTSF